MKNRRDKTVLTIAAVAILALAIGQVQAETVTVPNSDFELIYKPGQTTITGVVPGWTQGVGPECPIDNGEYTFSDTTTGTVADIPGWVGYDRQGWIDLGGTYDRDQTTGNLQGCITQQGNRTPDGLHCFVSNGGGYGNAAGGLIVSDASLGNVKAAIYTLSVYVQNGQDSPAVPRELHLLADGVVITPTSSVDPTPPAGAGGDWLEYTRTYGVADISSYVGQALTIVLGVGRPLPDGSTGAQSRFDDVKLDATIADSNAPSVDAGDDMIGWSGQVVQLDPNVVNNDPCEPQADLTYLWSAADPCAIFDPRSVSENSIFRYAVVTFFCGGGIMP